MLNRVTTWALAVFVAGMGIMGVVASASLLWAIWPEGWRSDGAAAWVQAVGSVTGIAIAIWVPAWQRSRERSAMASDTLLRLYLIAKEAVQIFANVSSQLRVGTFRPTSFDAERLSLVRANLAALDSAMLSSRMVVIAFALQDVLGELFEWQRHLATQPEPFVEAEANAMLGQLHAAMRISRLVREELAKHGFSEPDWRTAEG